MPNRDVLSPREVVLLQSQYHVEALKDGTMGPALRKEGDKFPAIELSRVQFLLLYNKDSKQNEYMALRDGPVPTEDAVESYDPVVSFREDGTEIRQSELTQEATNEGEYEGEVKPLEHTNAEEAHLKAAEEGKTSAYVERRTEGRLPSAEKAAEYAELNESKVAEVERKEAEGTTRRTARKSE